ncbi:hypothetical protein ABK040_004835 [Willaertia magna]
METISIVDDNTFEDFNISIEDDEEDKTSTDTQSLLTHNYNPVANSNSPERYIDQALQKTSLSNSLENHDYSTLSTASSTVNDFLKEMDKFQISTKKTSTILPSKTLSTVLKKTVTSTTTAPTTNPAKQVDQKEDKENLVNKSNIPSDKTVMKKKESQPLNIEAQKQMEKILHENCELKLELTALRRELTATKKQQRKTHKHYKKVESEYQTMKQNQQVIMEKLEEKSSLLSTLKKQTKKEKKIDEFITHCKSILEQINSVNVSSIHSSNKDKTWDICTLEGNQELEGFLAQITQQQEEGTICDSNIKKFVMELLTVITNQNITINDLKNGIVDLGMKRDEEFRKYYDEISQLKDKVMPPQQSKVVKKKK